MNEYTPTVPGTRGFGRRPSEDELRGQMVRYGRLQYERGLIVAAEGNMSARIDERLLLVTPTGICKGEMSPEDLVVIDISGRHVSGRRTATSEVQVHLAIYEERPDVEAIVHAHPPTATAFTLAGVSLAQCVMPEVIVSLGQIVTVPYALPTTAEAARAIRPHAREHDALLMEMHGSVTVGRSLEDAWFKLERLEWAAQVTLMARQLGGVKALPRERVEELVAFRRKMGASNVPVSSCNLCGSCCG